MVPEVTISSTDIRKEGDQLTTNPIALSPLDRKKAAILVQLQKAKLGVHQLKMLEATLQQEKLTK